MLHPTKKHHPHGGGGGTTTSFKFQKIFLSSSFTIATLLLFTPPTTTSALKYNELQMKSVHNSYERSESMYDILYYNMIRSVEYDLHKNYDAGKGWEIYHDAGFFRSYSSVDNMEDGALILKEFHDNCPNHELVTVWIDFKGELTGDWSPDTFDQILIDNGLPLYTPGMLQGNDVSLKSAVQNKGWPDMEDVRGKFLFVIASGAKDYCKDDASCKVRSCFTAIAKLSDPNKLTVNDESYRVIYNQDWDNRGLGPAIHDAGYVSRLYSLSDINNEEDWNDAANNKFNHIATDQTNYHKDTYAITHNLNGYPFHTLNGEDVGNKQGDCVENKIYQIVKQNGDLWGRFDDIAFQYKQDRTQRGVWVEYTVSLSMTNSHCESWAKGGIMVREEVDNSVGEEGSPYFAVLRGCGRNLLSAQYREYEYAYTVRSAADFLAPSVDTIEDIKRVAVKLRYMYSGKDTYAEAYVVAGPEKKDYLIDKFIFPDIHLKYHGLFTSSHYWEGNEDGTDFKTLFVNMKKDGMNMTAADFPLELGNAESEFGDGLGLREQ